MKRILTTLLFTICLISTYAQELSVKSFSLASNDISASSQLRLDGNGDACALVKVLLATQGASFEGNVCGDVKYDKGEYWVYMTEGSKYLEIKHDSFIKLSVNFADYGINSLKGKNTYVLTLVLPQNQNQGEQDLIIRVTPEDAIILIDGDVVETKKGQASLRLPIGSHSYNATKTGYMKQQGEIKLTADVPGKLIVELDKNNVAAQPKKNVTTQPQQAAKTQTLAQPANQNSSSFSGNVQTFTVKGVNFSMIPVEGGTFIMGATSEQGSDTEPDEKPTHSVTVKNYMMGETEVTQALWAAVMGKTVEQISNEHGWKTSSVGSNYPMYDISWNDCQEFVQKLNAITGKSFRLPTEAEWEYACRGGRKQKGYMYSGGNNLDDVAWNWKNSGDKYLKGTDANRAIHDEVSSNNCTAHVVKTKRPNELGLYDMSGNVYEWCQDWYDKNYYSNSNSLNPSGPLSGTDRVCRGGSWYHYIRYCRSSIRNYATPDFRRDYIGLRLAL